MRLKPERIVDMHCDTISAIWESRAAGNPQALSENQLHVDLRKMRKSGYLLQSFAMFVDLRRDMDPFEYVMALIDVFYEELEKNKNDIRVAKTYDDILANERQGRLSALLTIEEGGCCKGEIGNLEKLYARGARMMTLTWNYPNELGCPNMVSEESPADFDGSRGLTPKGLDFLERMEELGMIVDVSHLSDAGFWDVARHCRRPFVASHSNARAICAHRRNLTDEMIRAVAEHGGVIGLNYYGSFLDENEPEHSRVSKIAEHARHLMNVGGKECVGLGSDFDGMACALEMEDCSKLERLICEFERQKFTDEEIENILNRNVLRVYKEILR
ncbi:MAG: dipeptidase [Roseburia sp.]|nr:dipeptidase [Roseburia sp.]